MNNPGRKNLIAIVCVLGVMGMTGAAFAAVPLYRMFCQVTGFDGTVRRADKIMVLQAGRLVESGTHRELLTQAGLYARLYRANYASFDDIEGGT